VDIAIELQPVGWEQTDKLTNRQKHTDKRNRPTGQPKFSFRELVSVGQKLRSTIVNKMW